ncbi:MAG: TonB family protein [Gemmatimonadetes bacterium]|nr:TonB family protein [Gemmatimonadota bacterium]
MKTALRVALIIAAAGIAPPGCAYYNTLYNANAKFDEAQDQKRRADPEREKISPQEERLYTEAFEKAARVVKFYPESKWVDDALLLMGRSSFEKEDYSTALRKFDEILTFYPGSELTAEALLMKGRTLIETKDYDAGVAALTRAAELDHKDLRDDIAYFLGRVQEEKGNPDEALASYADLISRYRGSEWFAEAGMHAGEIEWDRGNYDGAVAYFEQVRRRAKEPEERYRGGLRKGDALLELGEWDRAKTTFHDVSKRTIRQEEQGNALLMKGKAAARSGNEAEAMEIFQEVITKYERQAAAGAAQLEIARMSDEAGDLEGALELYDLVKEQGTGHIAWQEASERRTEIQRVLDLRSAIEDEADPDREKNRYLLAEQLLEKIGDVDGAMAEYAALASDAQGTEWGAKALFAQAWIHENRLEEPQVADSLFFHLANYYSSGEVSAFARHRLGYPVWSVEKLDPPAPQFIRPEGDSEPQEVMLERVEPENLPLPEGMTEIKVWVRVQVAEDGSVASARPAKSSGEDAFDEAAVAAAKASRFLSPNAGGPEFTVVEYTFPPGGDGAAAGGAPGGAAPNTSTPNTSTPVPPSGADSTQATTDRPQPGTPQFRDRNRGGSDN